MALIIVSNSKSGDSRPAGAKAAAGEWPALALEASAVAVLAFSGVETVWLLDRFGGDAVWSAVRSTAGDLAAFGARMAGRWSIQAAILGLVALAEIIGLGWNASSIRRIVRGDKSGLADVVSFLVLHGHVGEAVSQLASGFLLGAAGLWAHHALLAAGPLLPSLRGAPIAVQWGVFYIAYGFMEYWCHRFQHHRLLWPLHRFHHAADEFLILTAARKHPAEIWPQALALAVTETLLGSPLIVVSSVQLAHTAINYLRHTRLSFSLGWMGRYLVQGPTHHRAHHDIDGDRQPCNFGIMPMWDHVFGTWREAEHTPAVGVRHPYRQGGLGTLADLLRDFTEFLLTLLRPWRRVHR